MKRSWPRSEPQLKVPTHAMRSSSAQSTERIGETGRLSPHQSCQIFFALQYFSLDAVLAGGFEIEMTTRVTPKFHVPFRPMEDLRFVHQSE